MYTCQLKEMALDWAAAKASNLLTHGWEHDEGLLRITFSTGHKSTFNPSLYWSEGGSIIEREKIQLEHDGYMWSAQIKAGKKYSASSPLVAAMRCYVASKLGDEVDVPAELLALPGPSPD